MTIILAIETSTDLASVALLSNQRIFSRDLAGVQTHSFGLLPAVQDLMLEACVGLDDINAIAFGCGPGAFTGVRTTCGVVQGLAFGLQIPVLPVVSLLSMAALARDVNSWCDVVCCLDARMNEVYWAHYRLSGFDWVEVVAPRLSDFDAALTYAAQMQLNMVVGKGLEMPESIGVNHMIAMPHARSVLQISEHSLRQGLGVDADQAQPLYLRNKIALTTAERQLAREA
ncbi:tRNA (adenosine(37)-N6)-threonylcarbamoyltransferase complex dimerization subunit type 1 TsaB [Undibacterium seohonense]|uniref:tRNA (Adenosine(37)-N6)-threonylcarbamoyltransferase complex dimerization subunit type 1 TsaB n=1 Tax=Undibacterium seohonense TaxID=1344950 RepID=A0ABR6X858_9BURK|nr:tRNA (adenosine(37)-N6)-threonylcarbamoyltransferase complex dimerization subunit type 1 TsaB [Undibacterium seohonense]MBC3808750.1 tRNA (adenosine(37)-N6)-threonylcarbamoyltransferase complex dimerization subunit type 1 TsaB [Undibacterium seohonense]